MTSTSGRFPARLATAPEAEVLAREDRARCNLVITFRKVTRSASAKDDKVGHIDL
jgi:hypothetical protein